MLKKIIKFFRENPYFFIILAVAASLRFYWIGKNPPALNWDEVSHGYNAYSILMSGKDEWGNFFPAIFRAYGDYKLPVYIYLTSISEVIFGLNTFAVRLPSVLAGIGTVIFSFLLARKFFGNKVATLAAFLVSVEPWSLFLSRGAFEANLSVFFIVSGVYLFILGLKKRKYLLTSSFFFGLSVWTYNSARVFVPLLLVLLFFLFKKELLKIFKKRKTLYLNLLVLSLFFIPMFFQLLNPTGQARYEWVAILDEGAIARINEARVTSELHPTLNRLTNNRYLYFGKTFVANWFSHFSPDYLFFEGGDHFQFSLPGHGLLYLVNIIFFPLGLILLLKRKDKASYLILGWLLLAPVPSSLTREAPHALRSITILPIPMIISSFGFFGFVEWAKKRYKVKNLSAILVSLYVITTIFMARGYLENYFIDYRENYSWAWQYGYEEVVNYVKSKYEDYDKIVVTKKYGEPHEFFLFYWPWEPTDYRNDENLSRFFQSNWYWVDRFDKFYFVNDWDIPESGMEFTLESGGEVNCDNEDCLLITSPESVPEEWTKVHEINFLDGETAFEIYEN